MESCQVKVSVRGAPRNIVLAGYNESNGTTLQHQELLDVVALYECTWQYVHTTPPAKSGESYKKFRDIDLENLVSSSCDFWTSSSYICQASNIGQWKDGCRCRPAGANPQTRAFEALSSNQTYKFHPVRRPPPSAIHEFDVTRDGFLLTRRKSSLHRAANVRPECSTLLRRAPV